MKNRFQTRSWRRFWKCKICKFVFGEIFVKFDFEKSLSKTCLESMFRLDLFLTMFAKLVSKHEQDWTETLFWKIVSLHSSSNSECKRLWQSKNTCNSNLRSIQHVVWEKQFFVFSPSSFSSFSTFSWQTCWMERRLGLQVRLLCQRRLHS